MSSGEKPRESAETNIGRWSELEGLSDGYVDDGVYNIIRKETLEERQEKISQAKAKVEGSYKKGSSKYDAIERHRVDRIKSDLNSFNIGEYERKQSVSQPNAFTKTTRLIADKLGIRTKRSEERREREAIHTALNEYHEEEAARIKAAEERERIEALERERRNAEYEAEKVKREKEALEKDMATARDVFDYNKSDRFKTQRIQEMVERDLNSRLLTVDNLEMEAISENPEIQKRIVTFEDAEIPVYDLKGFPFSILSTTVDYKKYAPSGELGTEFFKTVLKDPSVWTERRDEAEKASGFGTKHVDARGDTISASYWNSERNIGSHVHGDLIYGFESVRADSIIRVINGDGGTSNMAGGAETILSDPDIIKQLEGADGTNKYNEVLLRRYTENGIPKRPDYIIVENGRITEESLRHAKYFGIQIVNIERSVYEEKAEKKGEELLASISENDTYEEMNEKIENLLSMSKYRSIYNPLEDIGRNCDIPSQRNLTSLEKRCLEVSQMEQFKRLDFVKNTLEEAIYSIESATEKGLPAERKLPGFESFNISIIDVQNQLWRTEHSDEEAPFSIEKAPGSCNFIDINFKLKGSSRSIKTRVHDGKRVCKAEEALATGRMKKEDIDNADSGFYDALEPVVLKYFEAIRKNRQFKKTV